MEHYSAKIFPSFLKRKHVRSVLTIVVLVSLVTYLFPLDSEPPLATGTWWTYHFDEKFLYGGNISGMYIVDWKYSVTQFIQDTAYIEVNGTSEFQRRADDTWTETYSKENWQGLVKAETRITADNFFCSWWIPSNLKLGDMVPIWDLRCRITGLAWRIVGGSLLECWVLESNTPSTAYVFYYERTTGYFIYLKMRSLYDSSEILIERSLVNSNFTWPALTFIRPFLIPTIVGAAALILLSFVKRARKSDEMLPEEIIF